MAFQIVIEPGAAEQIQALTAKERKTISKAIATKLQDQPTMLTDAIKRLRPNPIAKYQLAVGKLRVLYNVEGDRVILLVVGRKARNKLIVDGKDYREHQDNSPEQTGNGTGSDAE